MSDILSTILDQKRVEVALLDKANLRQLAFAAPLQRDFKAAITRKTQSDAVRLIAELKRASPSKGLLAPNIDLLDVGNQYQSNGAAAISVLTDEKFFQGKLQTLIELKYQTGITIPLLRKDFIIDESQLYQARAFGADSALLIVAALEPARLQELHDCAISLGLTPLVEVHNHAELDTALRVSDIQIIGVNNRNLKTFEVSLETTTSLLPFIPAGITTVAESGIFNASDVQELADAGIDAILVGEGIITSADIPAKVRELASVRATS
jgi:indole-3-glycerol phosphate synthase